MLTSYGREDPQNADVIWREHYASPQNADVIWREDPQNADVIWREIYPRWGVISTTAYLIKTYLFFMAKYITTVLKVFFLQVFLISFLMI
jgi:hypothetical protein